jgi:hypothetical protein
MRALGFAYRFVTNFAFLATVYLSVNYIEKYNNRAVLAIAILIYAGMRAAIALRSFYFFQRTEQLEIEARRVMALYRAGRATAAEEADRRRRDRAAPRRRGQILHRSVLSRRRRAALRHQDRGEQLGRGLINARCPLPGG